MIIKFLKLLIVVFTATTTSGCGLSVSGRIEGLVLEEGANKPIEGAIVVARWFGEDWIPMHTSSSCFHVETATTDESGRYKIYNTALKVGYRMYKSPIINIKVYKAGYQDSVSRDYQ